MPDISGFCALGYDSAKVDLSDVVAPPYDVIDAAHRATLAQRSPYSFVRIDLPEPGGDSRYREAADRLASWRAADPGLIVLPTHRVIHGVAGFARDRFLADVQAEFRVERVIGGARDAAKLRQALAGAPQAPSFAAVFAGDPDAHLLSLVDREPRSPAASELSVLHDRIVGRLLGIGPGTDRAAANIRYVSDTQGALDQIASGQGQLALMVRPATLAQIKQVADRGQVMPQKSTYLFPKLASGLILLPVDSPERNGEDV